MKKKILAIFLLIVMLFVPAIALHSSASSTITIDNKTHDYNEINTLPQEYSYGTLFWTDDTEVQYIQTHPKYTKQESERVFRFALEFGDTVILKITNCSIDADGKLCDVLITVSNVEGFQRYLSTENTYGVSFGESIDDEVKARMELDISCNPTVFGDLVCFWFNTLTASATFDMDYLIAGTDEPANVPYTVSSLYDFDVPAVSRLDIKDDYFEGNEGIAMKNANLYYDKSSTGWLIDAKNIPEGYTTAVSTPFDGTSPIDPPSNAPELQTSVVAVQQLTDAHFNLFYSGRSCGIAWVFISPYIYELEPPTITVDKNRVYEEESFNYTISQYVPNNYYADVLSYIEGIDGKYTSFVMQDELDDDLVVNGDISITNESGQDVSSMFDIAVNSNNVVTATLKTNYLTDKNFYSHIYNIHIPAYIKAGTGASTSTISNSAVTMVSDNQGTENLTTLVVDVELKYDVTLSRSIDKGATAAIIGSDSQTQWAASAEDLHTVNHGDSLSTEVLFKPEDGWEIDTVTFDGKTLTEKDYSYEDGVYRYSYADDTVTNDIDHIFKATTKAPLIVNYYEKGTTTKLSDSYTTTFHDQDFYNVTEQANKTISYYTLDSIDGDVSGTFTEPTVINVYYTRNQNTVTINYLDKATSEPIASSQKYTLNQGEPYDVTEDTQKAIAYYTKDSVQGNVSGTLTEDQEINVYYTRNQNTVVVNYLEVGTEKVLKDPYSQAYAQGSSYDVADAANQKIQYYTLDSVQGDLTGTVTGNVNINVYYTRNQNDVVIRYLEKGTDTVLADPVSYTLDQGDTYDVSEDANKTISYYSIDSVNGTVSGTLSVDTEIIVYYTRNQNTVTVQYLEKDSETVLADPVIKTFSQGTKYDVSAETEKSITHYSISSIDGSATGTIENNLTITVWYTRNRGSVIAEYVDEDGKPLDDNAVLNGLVEEEYQTQAKEFYGYILTEVPANASGKFSEQTITVTYVYALRPAQVIVSYVDEDGNELAESETVKGNVFDSYQTEAKTIYGYTLTQTPDNAKGEMTEEDITVTYVYRLKESVVRVLYQDTNGNDIADSMTFNGKVFSPYTTSAKEIYGYTLTKTPDNAQGTFSETGIDVIYVYQLNDAVVKVQYVDEAGLPLTSEETINGKVFDPYETSAKTFTGYTLTKTPHNATGTMTTEPITVTYVYSLNDSSVLVKYIDTDGNKLSDDLLIQGKVFDVYKTAAKTIYGYTLTAAPENAEGMMGVAQTLVEYVYELKPASVLVNYLDADGNPIDDSVTIEGFVFDAYASEEKDFPEYNLTAVPDNKTGTMTEEQIIVNFIYELKPAEVLVSYTDTEGNILADDITINGKVRDRYETESKTFYGYSLIQVPENAAGNMTTDPIRVSYVYALKEATVIANYLDEEGNVLEDRELISGKVFDDYQTQSKDIYGYTLLEVQGEEKGTMTEDIITVDYIYSLNDAVVESFFVNENGNELADPEKVEGKVFDAYQTESKEIYGYTLTEVPENAEGTMTEEPITVTYVYKQIPANVVVNYLDEDGNELAPTEMLTGYVSDPYDTEEKAIDGYELVETPDNASGEMTEEEIIVNYIYRLLPVDVPYTGQSPMTWIATAGGVLALLIGLALIIYKKKK